MATRCGQERDVFEDFVAGRGQALQRFGYALTGDWALAEDLLQTALARAYSRWSRIQPDDPEAYVRKIMLNTWSSWWRRRWRGELPTEQVPEVAGPDSLPGSIAAGVALGAGNCRHGSRLSSSSVTTRTCLRRR